MLVGGGGLFVSSAVGLALKSTSEPREEKQKKGVRLKMASELVAKEVCISRKGGGTSKTHTHTQVLSKSTHHHLQTHKTQHDFAEQQGRVGVHIHQKRTTYKTCSAA